MAILAASNTENNRTGNGSYKPLKRRKKDDENENQKEDKEKSKRLLEELNSIDKKNRRMRFKNSKDPVYVAFDYLDKQPLKQLAIDFVRDSLAEVFFFVSKFN